MKNEIGFLIFSLIVAVLFHNAVFAEEISGGYGNPFRATSLANSRIGRYDYKLSIRFRAKFSGKITSLRYWNKYDFGRPGYHDGDGGDINISIQADDVTADHLPSGIKLTEYTIHAPLNAEKFPRIEFPQSVNVVKGRLYHILFENIDPNQQINYTSLNSIYMKDTPVPLQPEISDVYLALLMKTGDGDWSIRNGHTPIHELYYDDGRSQGCGYMSVAVNYPKKIGKK